jgi:hypothetical protein
LISHRIFFSVAVRQGGVRPVSSRTSRFQSAIAAETAALHAAGPTPTTYASPLSRSARCPAKADVAAVMARPVMASAARPARNMRLMGNLLDVG